jgi:type I restriction enzyme S subunit
MITGAYTVMEVNPNFDKGFLYYFYLNLDADKRMRPLYTGLRNTISKDAFFAFKTFVPPTQEQTAIANFLDDKTAKIDQAIAQKEKMIVLLKERKQIIIQNAVTKGLDPNVKMKDSGVEWIGEIPEHWSVERSQWLFKERKERARGNDIQLTSSQKYGVISQEEYMNIEGRRVTQVLFNREIQKHVDKGDFMISMRSFQGGIEYSEYEGCISSAYVSLIPSDKIEFSYYKLLFKSEGYIKALQTTSDLVRDGQALRFENFKKVPLLIIPIEEQKKIGSFVNQQDEKIKGSIALQLKQIEKLKEYKATIIDSAVTGKIKVNL